MATPSRSAQFAKLHKVLKKYYKPVSVSTERPILEHLIFGCLLEDAAYEVTEETFASVMEEYFDWNEMRVSSVRELTETTARLPDPPATAGRLKRILQHVFEASYSFDLEGFRKKNLGPACDALKKIDGTTPFSIAYVVQSALGGHSIPLDAGTMEVMRILELATDKEVDERSIAGLERAIPKSKGVEFGSLLHQLGAEFTSNPFSADLRNKLQEIEPEAKKRWPKRQAGKKAATTPEPAAAKAVAADAKAMAQTTEAAETTGKRKKPAATKPAPAKKELKKKTAEPAAGKDAAAKSKSSDAPPGKKAPSGALSKRKPR
jgi:endonuclease III